MKRYGKLILLLACSLLAQRASAEEISISYTASTLTFLAGRVAIAQGFFRQENVDVKFVQVRTAALTPALANCCLQPGAQRSGRFYIGAGKSRPLRRSI